MKKEIRVVDKKKGIIQITTLSERWYAKPSTDEETGLPLYEYIPSVTWICGYYPKGIGFMKWLAGKGWDEAEAIKVAAGDKGSKVHIATEVIEKGDDVNITDSYPNKTTGLPEELCVEEVDAIKSFADWVDEVNPEVMMMESCVFGENYAGTIDRIYRIDGQVWVIDLKTSKYLWPEHTLQVSAYSHAKIDYEGLGISEKEWKERKLAILQLGYNKYRTPGKPHFKFTEVPDRYDLFESAYKIWQFENPNTKPKTAEYPLVIRSMIRSKKVVTKKTIKK